MRKILSYIFFALLGLCLIVFFVANRQKVKISMDPFDLQNPALFVGPMPMWSALAFSLAVGFGLGAFGMWLSGKDLRRRAKDRKAEIKRLQHELKLAAVGTPREESDSRALVVRG